MFKIRLHERKSTTANCIYLYCGNKKLVEFFNSLGFVDGNKISNMLGIPNSIKKNKKFLQACIRGLIDTDGSIFRLSNKDPNLKRISFKNNNQNLLNDVRCGLLRLGFNPSKVIYGDIFLTRKADIEKYMNEIGFGNYKNVKRFIELSPVIAP